MTPEQYFSRLKAKLHMRMKLDEYDMKGEKNYNLYEQFMAVSRNLNKAKQDFQDEKQQKRVAKIIEKMKKQSKKIDSERIEWIKDNSLKAVDLYKEVCEKAINWKVYTDDEYDEEVHRLNDPVEDIAPLDYWLEPEGQPGQYIICQKLQDIEDIFEQIFTLDFDNREKDYFSEILKDKEYVEEYKDKVQEAYKLLAKIPYSQWFYDRLEMIELEYCDL